MLYKAGLKAYEPFAFGGFQDHSLSVHKSCSSLVWNAGESKKASTLTETQLLLTSDLVLSWVPWTPFQKILFFVVRVRRMGNGCANTSTRDYGSGQEHYIARTPDEHQPQHYGVDPGAEKRTLELN